MAEKTVLISQQLLKPIKLLKWKVDENVTVSIGGVILLYNFEGASGPEQRKLKSTQAGTVHKLLAPEGAIVKPGEPLLYLRACIHPTVMKDMCAECGADLRKDDITTTASVPMVHSIPELKVSEELAQKLGKADGERLLRDRKLVLLVDLDQTLIHTTNDNIPPNIRDVYHFQLYGPNSPWYHTRLRPGTHTFLKNVSPLFELHICTFGARNYAHTITMFLDGDQTYFSNRILSRDECFDPTSKKANLKALFPCGDDMVCIIDDREDVWNHALNLIHVKPYHFFQHTGDINAPPGLDKHENDDKEGVDLSKVKKKPNKLNGKNVKDQNGLDVAKTNGETEVLDKIGADVKECADVEMKEVADVECKERKVADDKDAKVVVNNEQEDCDNKEDKHVESKEAVEVENKEVEKTKDDDKEEPIIEEKKLSDSEDVEMKEVKSEVIGMKEKKLEDIETKQEETEDVEMKEIKSKDCETKENKPEDVDINMKTLEDTEITKDKPEEVETIENKTLEIKEKKSDDVETTEKTSNEAEINEKKLEGVESKDTKLDNVENMEIKDKKSEEPIKKEQKVNNNVKSPEQNKEDDLIEIEDPDDYLLHLEDILRRIHRTFYEMYDKMESGNVPDLKQVIPNVRNQILQGTKLVFSGLVPTHIKLEQSKAYQVARSLGATVTQDIEDETTHLVAVRPGTAKVNAGRRKKNLKIVTPDWLWSCAERWEHVEEAIYPLNSKGSKNRHPPPHCSSPEHVPNYPTHDLPIARKRTPSGRFMDTINPLMSFSSDDIADMDKEVEDILDDESDESEEETPNKTQEESTQEKPEKEEESSSSSGESLTGEYPRGFKRSREKRDLNEEELVESSLDEFPSTKFRRGEQLDSDLDIGQDSNSEGSAEAPDEVDDGEWNMMGAALEREFLSNN